LGDATGKCRDFSPETTFFCVVDYGFDRHGCNIMAVGCGGKRSGPLVESVVGKWGEGRWGQPEAAVRRLEGMKVGEHAERAVRKYEGVSRAERDRLERSDSRGAGSPEGEINV
jgi:hypothetical protein